MDGDLSHPMDNSLTNQVCLKSKCSMQQGAGRVATRGSRNGKCKPSLRDATSCTFITPPAAACVPG